jgi:predicted PurR-regulated permease PerM
MQEDAGRAALIERGLLAALVLGLLAGVVAVVWPFTSAILFGATLATAAWPLRQALVRCRLRRGAAAAVLLLCSLALVAAPILGIAPNLADQVGAGVRRVQGYFAASPAAPAWLSDLPLVGHQLALGWKRVVEAEGNLRTLLAPYTAEIEQMMVAAARALADSVLQVILSLAVATMFWANGDAPVVVLRDALRRLGGETAERMLDVAASAVRGVAYGVVGTAAIQAVLLAIGLAVAGVPQAASLGFVGLLLWLSQIGALLTVLIWGGAAWWLFGQEHVAWGAFMVLWGVIVSTIDNFIKPWLIGFGFRMPTSLTMLGVFGGFAAFGFLGLFIGPALMAVSLTLLQAWRGAAEAAPPQSP